MFAIRFSFLLFPSVIVFVTCDTKKENQTKKARTKEKQRRRREDKLTNKHSPSHKKAIERIEDTKEAKAIYIYLYIYINIYRL